MSSGLTTGMRLEVRPRDQEDEPTASAFVFDDQHEPTIRFRKDLPDWCTPDAELVATLVDDRQRPVTWTVRVARIARREHFAMITMLEEPRPLERRRTERPVAPVPVEWSQPPDRRRHPGVGIDLSHLGVRFRAHDAAGVRLDRIVLALILPSGAITAQGRVVGIEHHDIRVEFIALHPEALRRLVEWEALLLVGELAAPSQQIEAGTL